MHHGKRRKWQDTSIKAVVSLRGCYIGCVENDSNAQKKRLKKLKKLAGRAQLHSQTEQRSLVRVNSR